MFDNVLSIYENLFSAIHKPHTINDEAAFDVWFKLIQLLQEKIIFHPTFKFFEELPQRSFNILKNAVLNQPFEISDQTYNFIRKLFAENILLLSFENLNKKL